MVLDKTIRKQVEEQVNQIIWDEKIRQLIRQEIAKVEVRASINGVVSKPKGK